MLRLYFIQLWNNFSDEATEDALYDMPVLARFVGIDVLRERVPDATTLMNFRHLLEAHQLAPRILDRVNALLEAQGLLLREGTIVDATLIAAPPSTKNQDQRRDPDMHQTKKGNNWHFGMKMHIGVDAASGLIHTAVGTAANVSDVVMAGELLHGQERRVYADAGYTGVSKRKEHADRAVDWHVALKRGQVKQLPDDEVGGLTRHIERLKACVRSKVEHPFHTVKNLFGHRKTRYRGLAKNTHQWQVLFALANVYRVRRQLLVMGAA
jgi:IS5 family transposase